MAAAGPGQASTNVHHASDHSRYPAPGPGRAARARALAATVGLRPDDVRYGPLGPLGGRRPAGPGTRKTTHLEGWVMLYNTPPGPLLYNRVVCSDYVI
jgi:hypothetical protein